mmetsp:Transcript_16096/g.40776  ORF Transcript_16096/g.40776 Transcript_16096/m.40776 type:complete len:203 (-) Transcript_16096:211-819(-)
MGGRDSAVPVCRPAFSLGHPGRQGARSLPPRLGRDWPCLAAERCQAQLYSLHQGPAEREGARGRARAVQARHQVGRGGAAPVQPPHAVPRDQDQLADAPLGSREANCQSQTRAGAHGGALLQAVDLAGDLERQRGQGAQVDQGQVLGQATGQRRRGRRRRRGGGQARPDLARGQARPCGEQARGRRGRRRRVCWPPPRGHRW